MEKKVKSFIIIASMLCTFLFITGLLIAVTYKVASQNMYRYLNFTFLIVIILLLLYSLIVSYSLFYIYKNKKASSVYSFFAKSGMRLIFPVFEVMSRIFGVNKDSIRDFYISVNNILVDGKIEKYNKKYAPSDVIIILPHCIQNNQCNIKITGDINLCVKCGKCNVKDVVEIIGNYGLKAVVVNGGTSARNAVAKEKPKFIISVACERDLAAGIADVSNVPVIGIVNKRPNGPCFNTEFDVEELKIVIERTVYSI